MDPLGVLRFILEIIVGILKCFYYGTEGFLKLFFPTAFHKNVNGDIVIITGAGSGIGRLMAQKLAQKGAIIVTVDINKKGNDETVKSIQDAGGKAHGYICDLTKKENVYSTFAKIKNEIGAAAILVNNAGIVSGSHLLDTADEKIDLTYKLNVLCHFWTIKSVLPDMIARRKGHIVTIASLAGHSAPSKLVDYASSKFAAVGLDDALRMELRALDHGNYIKTTCVCPYYINTGMFDGTQSKILPILEPEYVAQTTVDGILTNSSIIFLPWVMKYLLLAKYFAPMEGCMALLDAFGVNQTMDNFTGRKKKA